MGKLAKNFTDDKNWYKDRYQHVLVQRKFLTVVTLVSLGCTLFAVFDIAQLTPLKTVEPFVIQVDQKSGITQTVDPLTVQELTANEAVNNFFIVQYIRAREGYVMSDLRRNYNIVRVMSEAGSVYPEFIEQADPNNPQSNAARLGASGEQTIRIQSITYLNPQLAQVHLVLETNTNAAPQHKIANVTFEYIKLNLTNEDRYINPLGFRVTGYRLYDEDVPQK